MTSALLSRLQGLDLNALPISDYMRRYLKRLLPVADYYFGIYEQGLQRLLAEVGKPAPEVTLVDYGGGCGLLSLLALEMGIGNVIYVDIKPECADCYRALGGRGTIVVGDAEELLRRCIAEDLHPDMLFGADVIEHVYSISDMLAFLLGPNPRMPMLFTTASTPWNRRIVRRLHKVMVKDELLFRQRRKEFIASHFPDLNEAQLDRWAEQTRGLVYDDVLRAVENDCPNLLRDPFNTCDPATGSWTERILPIAEYRQMLSPYGYRLQVELGWYNPANRGVKGLVQRYFNRSLSRGLRKRKAPFLFLYMFREK